MLINLDLIWEAKKIWVSFWADERVVPSKIAKPLHIYVGEIIPMF